MSPSHFWNRKRIWLPAFAAAALAAAIVWAARESNASTVVVYNETLDSIAGLRLSASGQSTTRRNLPEGESLLWTLQPKGGGTELELELATEPPHVWKGGYIEPTGGFRVSLRIFDDGVVEYHAQISIWRRWFWGAPKIDE